ncbi:GFA family protein [Pseudomonas sp. NY15181]|uniref:GFA family protein n=1 Tax=Pseudomonas sp. NY15181 TaxID=3400349 RepID=UPI003A8379EF
MLPLPLFGGCACGAVRYRVDVEPAETGYCHCRICQKSNAAPAVPWAVIPLTGFQYLPGELGMWRSSEEGERRFCVKCGMPLEFRVRDGETVGLNSVTLDEPELVKPQCHIWCSSQLSWFDTVDDLPRRQEG